MSDPSKTIQLHLISDYLQKTINEENAARLLSLMETAPVFLEQFVNSIQIDVWLAELFSVKETVSLEEGVRKNEWLGERDDLEKIFPFIRTLDPSSQTVIQVEDPIDIQKKGNSYQVRSDEENFWNRFTTKKISALAISISLFLVLGIIFLLRSDSKDQDEFDSFQSLATISETIDTVWEENGATYKKGQKINLNMLALKSGLVKVVLNNGAELILEGPAQLVLLGQNRTFCDREQLSVTVPPEAHGFEVRTPYGIVVDRGTEFFLDVQSHKADLSVIKGVVDVQQSEGAPVISATPGKYFKIASNQIFESFSTQPIDFIDRHTFQTRQKKYVKRLEKEEELLHKTLTEIRI